jgi:hypothetical protein
MKSTGVSSVLLETSFKCPHSTDWVGFGITGASIAARDSADCANASPRGRLVLETAAFFRRSRRWSRAGHAHPISTWMNCRETLSLSPNSSALGHLVQSAGAALAPVFVISSRLSLFFLLLELEFLVIHYAADWGLHIRRDFHQIETRLAGHFQGLSCRHNAQDRAVRAHQPNRRFPNLIVDAMRCFDR